MPRGSSDPGDAHRERQRQSTRSSATPPHNTATSLLFKAADWNPDVRAEGVVVLNLDFGEVRQ
jgi:hypothetical protein